MEQFLEPLDEALGCFKYWLEDVPGEVSRGQEKPRDTSKIRVGCRLPSIIGAGQVQGRNLYPYFCLPEMFIY